uniref:transposase n=1 Tax=uncultured Legionella sp. TaxID=210934 RepID=UPI002627E341
MKNKGGRPRKLTPEIKDAIVEGVEKGFTLKAACKYAGVSYGSLANWKRLAKADDVDAVLYQDLITSINVATRLLWCQH